MVWNGPDGPLMKNLNIVFSLLSLIGSAWMSYFCLNPHRMKSVLHQFIFSIAIIDLIFSLVNLISLAESYDPTPVEPLCKIEAILRFWCWRFSIILPTAIAFLCYKDSSRTEPEDTFDQSKFFKYVLGGFSALLLVMSLIPLVFPEQVAYTNGELYCYINYNTLNEELGLTMKLIILTLYEGSFDIAGLTISGVSYFYTVRRMKRLPSEIRKTFNIKPYKLFWYPAILLILFLPIVFDKYYRISGTRSHVWMTAIHLSLSRFVGVYNALVYGFQRRNSYQRGNDSKLSGSEEPPSADKSRTVSVEDGLLLALNKEVN